jgi:hypothetical protein
MLDGTNDALGAVQGDDHAEQRTAEPDRRDLGDTFIDRCRNRRRMQDGRRPGQCSSGEPA